MTVTIPVTTKYDGRGFNQLERDAKRAQQAQIQATRQQIAEHRRVASLTAKLDKEMAAERQKSIQQMKDWGQAALVAGGIIVAAGAQAVGAARESIAAEKELQGVLNSTGKEAAGFKDELIALATELENNSNFSDEAIQHTQALLLTYEKAGRDVIPRATQAAADLAELLDGDLQAATMQVGKALDGQISALKRSGVSFTEAQEEQIDALFKAGRAAEAHNIILTQLEKQVSGQAKAAREAAGGWKDMEVSAGRLEEAMGSLLLAIGDSGVSGAIASFLDRLTAGAGAWESAIENVQLLTEAQSRLTEESRAAAPAWAQTVQATADWVKWINPLNAAMDEGIQFIGQYIFGTDALAEKVQDVAKEQQDAQAAADANAKALRDEADAASADAAAQADLAAKLEAANAARRDVAGELLDITEQAAEDTADTWDQFFEDEQQEWADHSERIGEIQADSAKEQQRIQEDLAKSLRDIDKDLAKDLAKIDQDLARNRQRERRNANRQIERMEQDAARQERQQARRRQIDTMADQRLFDFDMRQLAAEGEFNQILAARERRAIEQQIAAEQATEEQRAEEENRQVEIDRAREDAEERIREMEAEAESQRQMRQEQAEEQRQAAIEQAAEEEARRQEELAQALADEEQNYQDRMEALRQHRDEKLAQIEETKQESIAKLAEELTENKDLTKEEMEALIPIAAELGEDVGTAFAEGLNEGFERNQRIDEMVNSLTSRGTPTHPAAGAGGAQGSHPGAIPGFQHGGSFTVGGSGGPDSQLVMFQATPGERVTVNPAHEQQKFGLASAGNQAGLNAFLAGLQSGFSGGAGASATTGSPVISQQINVTGMGGADLAAFVAARTQAAAEQALVEYHDTVIVPLVNG